MPKMVSAAWKRVPAAALVAIDLRGACLAANSLDAITMWDVLDMVPDLAAELAECLRLLTSGGVISIRIRNVAMQLWLYGCYSGLRWLWRELGIRPPFAFHRYSFSREAIGRLLNRGEGCEHIHLQFSPDPG